MIEILAIGKKHEDWVRDGIERFEKRLVKPYAVNWTLLPHSKYSDDAARQDETKHLLAKISQGDFVLLLDERGELLSSPALSERLQSIWNSARNLKIIIGGAYGVSAELLDRADLIWSLSKLVFPHQLVRLILIEQIYRAQEITSGGSYHHQ